MCQNCVSEGTPEETPEDTAVLCHHCGSETVDYTTVDTDPFCLDCYDELFIGCAGCNEETVVEDVHIPDCGWYDGEPLCRQCYQNRYSICADCGSEIVKDTGSTNCDGEEICECCADRYTSCSDCGEIISSNDAYSDDYDDVYCESCWSNRHRGEDFEPMQFCGGEIYTELRSMRRFGVELETQSCPQHDAVCGSVFGAKEDGSISGKEFVSSILYGDDGLDAVRKFCRTANSLGFSVDTNCGFHLHLDLRDCSIDELKSIAVAYRLTQSVWQRFVSASRAENAFCRGIGWSLEDLLVHDSTMSFRHWANYLNRYTWCNFASYPRHRTVEIRLHGGTLSAWKITNWIKAHLRFVDAVRSRSVEELDAMFAGGVDDKFAAMAKLWDDDQLTTFFEERSAHFGHPVRATVLATN